MNYALNTPLCRASDPLTSFESADSAKQFIRTHENLILRTLSYHGPKGVDAISALSGLELHAVSRRMKRLEATGRAALTGRIVKSDSGRSQREWRGT